MMKHLKVLSLCLSAIALSGTLSGCSNLSWSDLINELEKIDFTNIKDWEAIDVYGYAYGSYPYTKLDDVFTGKSIRPDKVDEDGNSKDILKITLHPDEEDTEKSPERAKPHDKDDYGECDYSLEYEYMMCSRLSPTGKAEEDFTSTGLGYYIITSKEDKEELDARYDEGAKYLPNGQYGSNEIDCYFQYQHVSNDRNYDDLIYYPDEEEREKDPNTFKYTCTYQEVRDGFYEYFAGNGEGRDDGKSVIDELKESGESRKDTAVDNVSVNKKSLKWRVVTSGGGRYTITLSHDNHEFTGMVLDYKRTITDEETGGNMDINARCIYQMTDWTTVKDRTWTEDEE